ncbi:ABC transporter ATP-binding protein [Polymorphum gilvum]|uniref:ABC multidrug efflux transporter, ATPase subunit n=1 Tax=Polymorphum gilvum (strain LMG 25793 / CGMCC 1.9160 / SL003B-26A1) TaxID=991905 RepID=F2IXX5_POLGS|nr:ABC transporter ATP-binding protein [Polymorphum gilvum]ADZ69456.1 ABC multidrug efflux transporter, ATPase subunit [Polymorphum gilvum SL003B-26A1]
MTALQITGVRHSFGKTRALDDVSLSVKEGSFTALLGVNGAGKTTLFSLITRLYDNVSGEILVCGYDVRRRPGPALASLGVVFQSSAMDRDLTVRQNLTYHAALHGLGRAETRRRIDEATTLVAIADRLDSRVSALSGGQQRRAEIARALMHGPRLLLLDEPTVGLDVKSRIEVVALVRRLVEQEGVAALWATHILDEIEPDDDVVVLHKGRVLAQGTAGALAGAEGLSEAFLRLTGLNAEAAA